MQSFWASNSLVATWKDYIISWWNNYPPRILGPHIKSPPIPLPGCSLRKATPQDRYQLPEFWNKWFSQSNRTKCCITLSTIESAVQNGNWEIWVMIRVSTGEIVGSIVRRWVQEVHVKEARIPKAGMIDYLCVHPAWRKKGIARRLLFQVQADTLVTIPHFFLWEGFQVSIPPIVSGMYWIKHCKVDRLSAIKVEGEEAVRAWNLCKKSNSIYSQYRHSNETNIWKTRSGYVVVWNTYHRTIPEGEWIGIILGISSENVLDEFTRQCPYGILVSDTYRDGWNSDTPFQWIAYALNPGFTNTSIPYLCL